jgi:hypothetical protein
MSLWRILAVASIFAAISFNVYADIYVYEVVTQTRRFQTASKMLPNAFLRYNGGSDVIYELIIVDKIKGDNFEEAAKTYKLGENNYRDLSPKASKRPDDFRRFNWWR